MEEIINIINKYEGRRLDDQLGDFDSLVRVSAEFYSDVADIYDAVTRIRNIERNPTGFDFNDAAVLGLLVRIWKILKEVIYYYRQNNGQIISHLDRQILEAAIVANYLLLQGDEAIEDYRKCSYKDRLNIITDTKRSPEFFASPAGIRLKESIYRKLEAEGFDETSFEKQKKNKWRLGGKSFYQIFIEIEPEHHYKLLYGIPSESIHGSWNESLDFDLVRNEDGSFLSYPHYQPVDPRFVSPLLRITNDPYLLWLERIEVSSEYLTKVFMWIEAVNKKVFLAFEDAFAARNG